MKANRYLKVAVLCSILLLGPVSALHSQEQSPSKGSDTPAPGITITGDMAEAAKREAAKVKQEIENQARSLFQREPLGWNVQTAILIYRKALLLPLRIPDLTERLLHETRMLGLIGSLLTVLIFLVAFYTFTGRNRIVHWAEEKMQPLGLRIPSESYPYLLSFLKLVVSSLMPLFLLGLFSLAEEMVAYKTPWFRLCGRLLELWVLGTVILSLLRETLTRDLFKSTSRHGRVVFRYARLILLYVLVGIAALWGAETFEISREIQDLLRFVVFVSTVTMLFLFFLRKNAFLSFFPVLPYRGYRWFVGFLDRYYYPLLILSFLSALLWSFGYQALGRLVLSKIWFTLGALLALTILYYGMDEWLGRWSGRLEQTDETARFLVRSLKSLLLYAAAVSAVIIVLDLLGLLDPLRRILSFPMFKLGGTPISLWVLAEAVLILLAFVFASRLLQAYLDYRVYPAIGVDPGLGYALNTFFKYLFLAAGLLVSLRLVGLDLRFLLVFAGAAGIGIGLGLQSMAASVISGFIIIFGGKIRKGDWIQTEGTLGIVTDIYLRATKVLSRDNVEYLIPNSELISKTIVNYSLSSPMIRISLPVGVSYNSDPREVERILLEVASKEPLVSKSEQPAVCFVGYGDSAINFELMVWIDVRTVPHAKLRSALNFAIFDAFAKAGIEIPFPQRDIHIRTKVP